MPVMKQTKTTRGTLSQVLRYLKRYTPALLLSLLLAAAGHQQDHQHR